ncbi:MAG: flagellar hook-basal body complex protein FliE [Woeseiaceae bacterium]|nr:flagellar hook-basal body complex protein FliE [Woeseiaceae bacterium]
MNEISPDQLLSQIRALGKNLQVPTVSPADAIAKPAGSSEFGQLLKSSLNAVNEAQQTAGALKTGFENGTSDASLAEVMIAAQKADLSFRAVTEVRNKLVQAYQDIMNMPV